MMDLRLKQDESLWVTNLSGTYLDPETYTESLLGYWWRGSRVSSGQLWLCLLPWLQWDNWYHRVCLLCRPPVNVDCKPDVWVSQFQIHEADSLVHFLGFRFNLENKFPGGPKLRGCGSLQVSRRVLLWAVLSVAERIDEMSMLKSIHKHHLFIGP